MPETRPDPALRAALHGVRGLLLDLDGVLVLNGTAVPGAAEAMAELDRRGVPVPGGDQHLARVAGVAGRLGRARGLHEPADRLLSALSASAALVRREYGFRPVYVIASDDAMAEFEGLNVVDGPAVDAAPGDVAAVVLGDSPDQLTKANLDRAFRLVRGGVELIGMHRNPWWITPEGPTLDAGAFLVALEWATGRKAPDRRQAVPRVLPGGGRAARGRGGGPRRATPATRRPGDGRRRRGLGHRRRAARRPADRLRSVRQARRRRACGRGRRRARIPARRRGAVAGRRSSRRSALTPAQLHGDRGVRLLHVPDDARRRTRSARRQRAAERADPYGVADPSGLAKLCV